MSDEKPTGKRAPNKRAAAVNEVLRRLDEWERQGHHTVQISWLQRTLADFRTTPNRPE